jgi:hypothetical protein
MAQPLSADVRRLLPDLDPPPPDEWVEVDGSRNPIPVQTEPSAWWNQDVKPMLAEGLVDIMGGLFHAGGRYLRGEDPLAIKKPKVGPVWEEPESEFRPNWRRQVNDAYQHASDSPWGKAIRRQAAYQAKLSVQESIQNWVENNRVTLVLAAAALFLLYLLRSDKGGGDYNLPNFPNLPGPNFGKRRYYYA